MDTPPDTLPDSLPVWRTTMDALDYCWRHRHVMFRYGLLPLAVSMATSFALLALAPDDQAEQSMAIVVGLIPTIFYLPFTVTWYRMVVHGMEAAASRPVFTLGRAEGRLLLWQFLLVLVVVLSLGAAVTLIAAAVYGANTVSLWLAVVVGIALTVPAAAGFLMVGARLSMVMALAALNEPAGFRTAWRMTRTIAWQLTGAVVLVIAAELLVIAVMQLAAFIVGGVIATAADLTLGHVVNYLNVPVLAVVGLVALAALATVFGAAYRLVTSREMTPDPLPQGDSA